MIPQKRTVIIARHGSTDMNDNGDRIRGWRNVPLNAHGRQQARDLGERLKKEKFDFIICSNLARTEETAAIISKETGKPVIDAVQALRPWDVGKFTGQESKVVIPQMKDYVEKYPDKKIPDGESFNEFKNRFLKGVKKILNDHPDAIPLLVCHHRNDRLMDAWTHGKGGDDIDLKIFTQKGIPPGDYAHYYVFCV